MLLESPYGARTEPRIREHFDRLVDRISTYEVRALAAGDGFTEKKYEPASIDELLAMSTTFGTPPAPPSLKDMVEADLQNAKHDIPIPLNERVLSYVELFQGRLHEFIEEGMKRGSKYLPMIQDVFRAEGLPLDLAYVPLVESAFKPNALSRVKAKGVWQFMTGTALENGLHRDWYIDERSDPEKATVAAAKYLRTLGKLFGGDWHLALASYNGGPGRMQRAMKNAQLDDFWDLAAKPKLLPRETREYVPMILAAIVIARNPAQYGFEFEAGIGHRLREGDASPSGRPASRGGMDRLDDRRDPGAQSRTAALDDAREGHEIPAEGARGHGRRGQGPDGRRGGHRPGVAEVLHREARRHAAAHRQEAAREQSGSGGGELPARDDARRRRPEADGAARSHRSSWRPAPIDRRRSPRRGERLPSRVSSPRRRPRTA